MTRSRSVVELFDFRRQRRFLRTGRACYRRRRSFFLFFLRSSRSTVRSLLLLLIYYLITSLVTPLMTAVRRKAVSIEHAAKPDMTGVGFRDEILCSGKGCKFNATVHLSTV